MAMSENQMIALIVVVVFILLAVVFVGFQGDIFGAVVAPLKAIAVWLNSMVAGGQPWK